MPSREERMSTEFTESQSQKRKKYDEVRNWGEQTVLYLKIWGTTG